MSSAAVQHAPQRQDTLQLRDADAAAGHEYYDHHHSQQHRHGQGYEHEQYVDEPHSMLEDDDEDLVEGDYDDDDVSSTMSVPNSEIDWTSVYALHTFLATVEGQASVVKGDSLVLLDDGNAYWWLVRVLKTQEIGYIPAENIETPFERLARLNKHRNVDLASATPDERSGEPAQARQRAREAAAADPRSQARLAGGVLSPPGGNPHAPRRSVMFTAPTYHEHEGYLDDSEEDEEGSVQEWDEEDYEEGEGADGQRGDGQGAAEGEDALDGMEPDDGMSWEDEAGAAEQERRLRAREAELQQQQQQAVSSAVAAATAAAPASATAPVQSIPSSLRAAGDRSAPTITTAPTAPLSTSPSSSASASGEPSTSPSSSPSQQPSTLRTQTSRERLIADPAALDPATSPTRKVTLTPSVAQGPGGPLLPSAIATQNAVRDARRYNSNTSAVSSTVSSIGGRSTPESLRSGESEDVGSAENAGAPGGSGKKRKLSKEDKKRLKKLSKDAAALEREAEKERKKSASGGGGGGILGGLFKKKEKKPKTDPKLAPVSSASLGGLAGAGRPSNDSDSFVARESEDSLRHPRSDEGHLQRTGGAGGGAGEPHMGALGPRASAPVVPLGHGIGVQQRDQQQQQLYQQYLARNPPVSPTSPTSTTPSYAGLQPLSTVAEQQQQQQQQQQPPSAPSQTPARPRPGSLIAAPTLSVLRIFAGPNVHCEATFKTVLLSHSTSSADLVRQAMQRFRLPPGEREADYYLAVKELEGGVESMLRPDQAPLGVFEDAARALGELAPPPSVKRSSVGSISSIASNLSLNPAITRLGMSDFSDDSVVKLYLHRRDNGAGVGDRSVDLAISDAANLSGASDLSRGLSNDDASAAASRPAPLALDHASSASAADSARLVSPTARFALQVAIHPSDLPEGLIFDPTTSAIVPRSALAERSGGAAGASANAEVSRTERRKVLFFPRNVSVAEVIEAALDRFGILEGVVEGGDDVEDKVGGSGKRRSVAWVRYRLAVAVSGSEERALAPNSRAIDVFPRAPLFKVFERRSADLRRRSLDASLQLGTPDDVAPSDPVFVLRRATPRPTSRRLTSNEAVAAAVMQQQQQQQQQLQRQQRALPPPLSTSESDSSAPAPSLAEIIAAQRAASRANQRAILGARENDEQGVDLLLADQSTIRSSIIESDAGEPQVRYSYVHPDGESYDISDIMEQVWSGARPGADSSDAGRRASTRSDLDGTSTPGPNDEDDDERAVRALRTAPLNIGGSGSATPTSYNPERTRSVTPSAGDLLAEVLQRAGSPGMRDADSSSLEERIDRVLARVKDGQHQPQPSPTQPEQQQQTQDQAARAAAASGMGIASSLRSQREEALARSQSPTGSAPRAMSPSIAPRSQSPLDGAPRSRSVTPAGGATLPRQSSLRQQVATASAAQQRHAHKPSTNTSASDYSSAQSRSPSPSTPVTSSGAETLTNPTPPSVNFHPQRFGAGGAGGSPSPTGSLALAYREDFGLRHLMAIVDDAAERRPARAPEGDYVERVWFGEGRDADLHPDLAPVFAPVRKNLSVLEDELDTLLTRALAL